MLNPHLSNDFSLDMQSVQRLRQTAKNDPEKGVEKSAKQFEAMFIQKMLKVMREAMPKSDLMHSNQMRLTQSLMDRQWAQTLSERGIGLADMMTRELQHTGAGHAGPDSVPDLKQSGATGLSQIDKPRTIAGIEQAHPRALPASKPLDHKLHSAGAQPLVAPGGAHSLFASDTAIKGAPLIELDPQASIDAQDISEVTPEHVRDFIRRMGAAAHTASEQSGVPQKLILAQAALETGWGRYEIPRADGTPSYNVFNIKATGWHGAVANAATIEYVNGWAHPEQAAFRAYDSYQQAFGDYARLLSQSPRYAAVAQAADPAAAARMLGDSGYATDPRYADKLVAIMDALPEPAAAGAAPLIDMDQAASPLFATAAARP